MRSILVSLLPLFSITALVAADALQVISDLNSLNNGLQTLDTDVKKVQSGLLGVSPALQVSVDTLAVDGLIIKTTNDVTASSKFSQFESQQIINAVDTVTKQANTTITDTIAQYSALAELAPVVLSALYALKIDQGNLGYALAVKLDQSVLVQGVNDLTALNNGFNQAIAAYGGTTS